MHIAWASLLYFFYIVLINAMTRQQLGLFPLSAYDQDIIE